MTAEQLEELAGGVNPDFIPMADWEEIITSLARRVIAAEKLVEALGHVLEDLNQHDTPARNDVRNLSDAFWAYREASK